MRTRFRGDIEGLRAVAVALPVLTHAFGILPGGVLGVDVFFVLSGFLVTGLLLRDVERNGTVRLGAFAVRRIRRLAPLAVTVVLGTVAVTAPMLFAPGRAALFQNALASLTGVENWHLMRTQTDYAAATDGASPLQNYWSLGVEEQFYVALPIVIALCALIAKACRRPRLVRALVAAVIVVAVVGSIAYCLVRVQSNPGALYLDTVGRVWELGFGGLAALAMPLVRNVPRPIASAGFLLGLVAVVGSAIVLQDEHLVPWPGALPAVLGTVLIALVGGRAAGAATVVVTNPVSRYVGRISYALYLWHFPVIVVGGMLFGFGLLQSFVAIAVSVLLAVASHHWIEAPVRDSGWLRSVELPATRPHRLVAVLVAPVLAVGVLGAATVQWKVPAAFDAATLAARLVPASAVAASGDQRFDAASLRTALAESGGTHVDAGTIDALVAQRERSSISACVVDTTAESEPTVCDAPEPGAERDAWLVGDSTAAAWADSVRAALGSDWNLHVVSNAACPVVDVRVRNWNHDPTFPAECSARSAATIDRVVAAEPDLVLVSSTDRILELLDSGATGPAAGTEWRDGSERLIDRLAGHADRVAFLSPPPTGANITECATVPTGLAGCLGQESDRTDVRVTAEESAARDAADPGVSVVDTRPWFCRPDGTCPPVIDGTAVLSDGKHLSHDMGMRISGLVSGALAAL